jgi:hypothetical protein
MGMLVGGATVRAGASRSPAETRERIREKVSGTLLVDTHEHLIEESDRLQGTRHPRVRCDDWAFLLSHYLDSDLVVAGMPSDVAGRFFSPEVDPVRKWELLEPYWTAVRHTGYGQVVRLACRELYGVKDLSADTIAAVQAGYDRTRRPGFYERVLREHARVE